MTTSREYQRTDVTADKTAIVIKPYLKGPRILLWAGCGLLLVWLLWLAISFAQRPLPRAVPFQQHYFQNRFTYILLQPFIGLDFQHNYAAVRTWRQGSDPYAETRGDPVFSRYTYPPVTLVAFAWTDLFPPGLSMRFTAADGKQADFSASLPAIATWTAIIVGLVSIAAFKAWRTRQDLGLSPLPFPFVLGATLVAYPVIFEIERGNCNTLPLLAIVVMLAAIKWANRMRGDWVAGLCVALAAGIKPYAVILMLGLVALRRFRAAAFAIGWIVLELIIFSPDLRRWLSVAQLQNRIQTSVYEDFTHSLISHWKLLWPDLGLPMVSNLPAQPLVALWVTIVTGCVAWRVFQARDRAEVAWPFFLWLAAMATLISPIAQDYNLLFIPLAVLAAWNSRDSWRVQLCVAAVLLWWQPFYIGITNAPWLLLKVVSIALVGVLIWRRLQDPPPAVELA
jgi:hypothetical protein